MNNDVPFAQLVKETQVLQEKARSSMITAATNFVHESREMLALIIKKQAPQAIIDQLQSACDNADSVIATHQFDAETHAALSQASQTACTWLLGRSK